MTAKSIEHYSDQQQRAAARCLDLLDRMDSRLDTQYSHARKHARRPFRGTVPIRLNYAGVLEEFRVWTRSISASGLSFLHPGSLEGTDLEVGVPVGPDRAVWFRAEVVRCREVNGERFWEHGVAFRGRVKD